MRSFGAVAGAGLSSPLNSALAVGYGSCGRHGTALSSPPDPVGSPRPWVLANTDKIRSRPPRGAPGHGFWLTDAVSHPDSHGCTLSLPVLSLFLPPPVGIGRWDLRGGEGSIALTLGAQVANDLVPPKVYQY